MPETQNTPRRMSTLSGNVLNNNSVISTLYQHPILLKYFENLTGLPVIECDDQIENIVATMLTNVGDTHGWHTDDYPFAFIMCLEGVSGNSGGNLEIKGENGCVFEVQLSAGDAYFMRSDLLQHRVKPITKNARRVILNFTYTLNALTIKPNGSAQKLLN